MAVGVLIDLSDIEYVPLSLHHVRTVAIIRGSSERTRKSTRMIRHDTIKRTQMSDYLATSN